MRTTIEIPDDLLETARSIARGRRQTLGQAVADLIRKGLEEPSPGTITISPLTGLPVIHLGRPTSLDDVRALEDDE